LNLETPFMATYYPSTGPPVLPLSERLARLHSTLDGLAAQAHDRVAHAIADAVAGALEQALRNVFGASAARTACPAWPDQARPWHHHRTRAASWDDGDSADWLGAGKDDSTEDDWREIIAAHGGPTSPPAATQRLCASRWLTALGAALRTALWWLQCRAPARPVLTTLAVAVTAGLSVLAAWPAAP
jgi:hypothetical protein